MTKKPAPKSKPEPKKDAPEPVDKKQPDAPAEPAEPGEPADTLDPIEDQGIGVRDPYPTGSGLDPREEYYKIHGRYPPEEEG